MLQGLKPKQQIEMHTKSANGTNASKQLLHRAAIRVRLLVAALLLAQARCVSAAVHVPRTYSELLWATNGGCNPELIEDESKRCAYVLAHKAECSPRSGLLNYIGIYYCWGLQYFDPGAAVLTVVWIAFIFLVMFTASDRFFCPALELLSEYLHLSPAVAGVTLLSFGNGAPDVFTQLSAIGSGGPDVTPESVSMALSEPLGTGLFVGNVVLGLTVMMAQSVHQVVLDRRNFLKDVLFYLGAVSMVLACLIKGRVYLWQCALLVLGYVSYVSLTIWLSRKQQRVQLDPLYHEVPRLVPFGPWDDLDSDEVEEWDWLEVLPPELVEVVPVPLPTRTSLAGTPSLSGLPTPCLAKRLLLAEGSRAGSAPQVQFPWTRRGSAGRQTSAGRASSLADALVLPLLDEDEELRIDGEGGPEVGAHQPRPSPEPRPSRFHRPTVNGFPAPGGRAARQGRSASAAQVPSSLFAQDPWVHQQQQYQGELDSPAGGGSTAQEPSWHTRATPNRAASSSGSTTITLTNQNSGRASELSRMDRKLRLVQQMRAQRLALASAAAAASGDPEVGQAGLRFGRRVMVGPRLSLSGGRASLSGASGDMGRGRSAGRGAGDHQPQSCPQLDLDPQQLLGGGGMSSPEPRLPTLIEDPGMLEDPGGMSAPESLIAGQLLGGPDSLLGGGGDSGPELQTASAPPFSMATASGKGHEENAPVVYPGSASEQQQASAVGSTGLQLTLPLPHAIQPAYDADTEAEGGSRHGSRLVSPAGVGGSGGQRSGSRSQTPDGLSISGTNLMEGSGQGPGGQQGPQDPPPQPHLTLFPSASSGDLSIPLPAGSPSGFSRQSSGTTSVPKQPLAQTLLSQAGGNLSRIPSHRQAATLASLVRDVSKRYGYPASREDGGPNSGGLASAGPSWGPAGNNYPAPLPPAVTGPAAAAAREPSPARQPSPQSSMRRSTPGPGQQAGATTAGARGAKGGLDAADDGAASLAMGGDEEKWVPLLLQGRLQELNAGLEEREQRRQQRQLSSVTDLSNLGGTHEDHTSPSSHPSHNSSHNGSNPSFGRSSKGTSALGGGRDQGPHVTWGDTLSTWLFGNTGSNNSTAAVHQSEAGRWGTPRGASPERDTNNLGVLIPRGDPAGNLGQASPPSSLTSPSRPPRPGSASGRGGVPRSVSWRVPRRPSNGAGEGPGDLAGGVLGGAGGQESRAGAGASTSQPASGSVTPTRRTALTEEELALEQKRLKKLLYYAHRQRQLEESGADTSAPTSAGGPKSEGSSRHGQSLEARGKQPETSTSVPPSLSDASAPVLAKHQEPPPQQALLWLETNSSNGSIMPLIAGQSGQHVSQAGAARPVSDQLLPGRRPAAPPLRLPRGSDSGKEWGPLPTARDSASQQETPRLGPGFSTKPLTKPGGPGTTRMLSSSSPAAGPAGSTAAGGDEDAPAGEAGGMRRALQKHPAPSGSSFRGWLGRHDSRVANAAASSAADASSQPGAGGRGPDRGPGGFGSQPQQGMENGTDHNGSGGAGLESAHDPRVAARPSAFASQSWWSGWGQQGSPAPEFADRVDSRVDSRDGGILVLGGGGGGGGQRKRSGSLRWADPLERAAAAEEQVAEVLLAVEDDEEEEAKLLRRAERLARSRESIPWLIWRALRRPIVSTLSLTMPMIERKQDLTYRKFHAVLLPILGPLVASLYGGFWQPWGSEGFLGDKDHPPDVPWDLRPEIRLGFAACVATSIAVALFYPRDGRLEGVLLAVSTVLAFAGSMLWMNAAADELVGLLVAVGHILELPPALLGATVLAWGNSLSDTVSNMTMARDGYPTMAITACFASPLFILLAGVACTLFYGASSSGSLAMPQDLPTLTLYATSAVNMAMWLVLIPCVFKFNLDKRITVIGIVFYIAFQAMFVPITLLQEGADSSI